MKTGNMFTTRKRERLAATASHVRKTTWGTTTVGSSVNMKQVEHKYEVRRWDKEMSERERERSDKCSPLRFNGGLEE